MYSFDEIIDRRHMRSAKWSIPEGAIGMGTADLDFRSPREVQEALAKDVAIGNYGYKSGDVEPFFEAVINWEKRRHGIELKREWLSFAPGVISGLSMAIYTLTQPGDRIVTLTPVYPPFFSLTAMDGRERVECPMVSEVMEDGLLHWRIDYDALEACCTGAAALLFCSPHNPVGKVWTEEELRKVVAVCQRTDCLLLVDEIHHDLMLDGRRFLTPSELVPEFADHIVTAGAPSKTFNVPGFSTSYVCARNPEHHKAIHGLQRLLHVSPGMYGYLVAETAYNHGDQWLDECLAYIQANRDFTLSYLREQLPDCPPSAMEGTYLCWVDLSVLDKSDSEIDNTLRANGVYGVRGSEFGDGRFMRLNIGLPRAVLAEGLARFVQAINRLR